MTTFVTVGNATQPFARLVEGVERIARSLPQPVIVQHGHTPFTGGDCRAIAFMPMTEFSTLVAGAALVITHAGAGTLIHALAARKRPVVMPRRPDLGEHIDGHQLELADAFASLGRIVLARDARDLPAAIADALSHSAEPSRSRPLLMVELITARLSTLERELCSGQSAHRQDRGPCAS